MCAPSPDSWYRLIHRPPQYVKRRRDDERPQSRPEIHGDGTTAFERYTLRARQNCPHPGSLAGTRKFPASLCRDFLHLT